MPQTSLSHSRPRRPLPIPSPAAASTNDVRWRVSKLGGTSMAHAGVVCEAASRLVTEASVRPVAVVPSALAGTTDQLLAILEGIDRGRESESLAVNLAAIHLRHRRHLESVTGGSSARLDRQHGRLVNLMERAAATRAVDPAERVEILTMGERLAAEILFAVCCHLAGSDVEIEIIEPGELMVVEGDFENATVDLRASRAKIQLEPPRPRRLWVVPGFFARGRDGLLRLLGRGGSDTSATLLGAVLDAERVEIWTDVDGVFPRDPRQFADQTPFERLTYDQAERLARDGARVLHVNSMAPARTAGLPVVVRNSFRPEATGTWIGPPTATVDRGATRPTRERLATWCRQTLVDLCAIDSTTGHEDRLHPRLTQELEQLGAAVQVLPVDGARANVLACWSAPERAKLLFSSHLDTVPPFLAPRPTVTALRGRGSCDAKGQIVAQLGALQLLLESGHRDVAWLGVVGEEIDGLGAAQAAGLARQMPRLRAVINGEPTELRLPSGQKGFLHLELICHGRRVHGSDALATDPVLGCSALWRLIDWLDALRTLDLANDPEFGREVWNLGRIRGGEAANSVAGEARAEIVARTVPGSTLLEQCQLRVPAAGQLVVHADEPPLRFGRLRDWPTDLSSQAVGFGSDAGKLKALLPKDARDRIFLFGPGSIDHAHTDDESIEWAQLEEAMVTLSDVGRRLLDDEEAGP